MKNSLVKDVSKASIEAQATDRSNPSPGGDVLHIHNLFDAIKKGTQLNADILGGHQSTLLVQLGNIALRSGETLHINPENGHIKNKAVSKNYWSREYEKGWEPKV